MKPLKEHRIIGVTSKFIAIEKKNREVVLIPITQGKEEINVELDKICTIKFNNNTIEATTLNDFSLIDF